MVAGTFHMDPVDVWKGHDLDVAMRLAASWRFQQIMSEASADG